jgi:hypothetical protein
MKPSYGRIIFPKAFRIVYLAISHRDLARNLLRDVYPCTCMFLQVHIQSSARDFYFKLWNLLTKLISDKRWATRVRALLHFAFNVSMAPDLARAFKGPGL